MEQATSCSAIDPTLFRNSFWFVSKWAKDSSQAFDTRSKMSSFSTANAAWRLAFWVSKSLLQHFVSWIFKLNFCEFAVRVEINEECPANDCELFSVIVAGNFTSELVAFPVCFSFRKWYWIIGFVSQDISVAA
jgi:hypothetical protein